MSVRSWACRNTAAGALARRPYHINGKKAIHSASEASKRPLLKALPCGSRSVANDSSASKDRDRRGVLRASDAVKAAEDERRKTIRLVKVPSVPAAAPTSAASIVSGGTRATPEATAAFAMRHGSAGGGHGDGASNEASLASYLRLPGAGDVGLVVSRIGFGSPWVGAPRRRQRQLRDAIVRGCNLIDLGRSPPPPPAPLKRPNQAAAAGFSDGGDGGGGGSSGGGGGGGGSGKAGGIEERQEEPWAARALLNMVRDGIVRREELVLCATVASPAGATAAEALDVAAVAGGIDALFYHHGIPCIDVVLIEVPPPSPAETAKVAETAETAETAAVAGAGAGRAYRADLLRSLPLLLAHLKHTELGSVRRRLRLVGFSFPGGCPLAPYMFWDAATMVPPSGGGDGGGGIGGGTGGASAAGVASSEKWKASRPTVIEDVIGCRDLAAAGMPLVMAFPVGFSSGRSTAAVATALAESAAAAAAGEPAVESPGGPRQPLPLALGPAAGVVLMGSGVLTGQRPSGRPLRFVNPAGSDGAASAGTAAAFASAGAAGLKRQALPLETGSEYVGGYTRPQGGIDVIVTDLRNAMNRLMHLEAEFERRFGALRTPPASLGGSSVAGTSTIAADETTAAAGVVPARQDMSWGHVLAAQHGRLAGLDEWMVARVVKVEPTAEASLAKLQSLPQTRDWGALYRALLPSLLDAVTASLRPLKERALGAAARRMDALAPALAEAAVAAAATARQREVAGRNTAAAQTGVAAAQTAAVTAETDATSPDTDATAAGSDAATGRSAAAAASAGKSAAGAPAMAVKPAVEGSKIVAAGTAAAGTAGATHPGASATPSSPPRGSTPAGDEPQRFGVDTVSGRCLYAAFSTGIDCIFEEEAAASAGAAGVAAAAVTAPLPPEQVERLYRDFHLLVL
ncbi:unnamed protein product [Phaeothamnion confervicola]